MIKRHPKTLTIAALLALPVWAKAVQINEIRIDEPGTGDVNEYVELIGSPGESLDNVWYLVLGDHSSAGNPNANTDPNYRTGTVEYAINLTGFTIPNDGLFLIARSNLQIDLFGLAPSDIDYLVDSIIFENSDNVTHLLVKGYTGTEVTTPADQWGTLGVDIDPMDDGVVVTPLPWAQTLDAIGLIEIPNEAVPGPEEFVYGELLGFQDIGPDRTFTPGHVFRGANDSIWNIGQFTLIASSGTALDANSKDTPGKPNNNSPDPILTPIITYYTPTIAQEGSIVTVAGSNFSEVSAVKLDGVAVAEFSIGDDSLLTFTVPSGTLTGAVVTLANPAGESSATAPMTIVNSALTLVIAEDFEDGLGDFTQESVTSNYTWRARTFNFQGFAEMNGFGADAASDDWLISPEIPLGLVNQPMMKFTTARNFSGPDLEVKISTDYTNSVGSATWSNLTATVAGVSPGGYALTSSGDVDLSAYAGQTVRIAFRYTSQGPASGQGATYQVHDFMVSGTAAVTPLWSTAMALTGDFFDTWFGIVYAAHAPWYYNLDYKNWFYFSASSSDDGAYVFDAENGTWNYTNAAIFPYYYSYADTAWLIATVDP